MQYSSQSDQKLKTNGKYEQAFAEWQKKDTNGYAFHGKSKNGMAVYTEGIGYISHGSINSEKRMLVRVNSMIGFAIILYLLIDNFGEYLCLAFLNLTGTDIGFCYSNGSLFGNQTIVFLCMIAKDILKFILPLLLVHSRFQMPKEIFHTMRLAHPKRWLSGLFAVMAIFALNNLWLLFSKDASSVNTVLGSSYSTISYMSPMYQYMYIAIEWLIVSIFTELLLHGEILHVLRQFGDWYAVILTGIIASCLNHNPATMWIDTTLSAIIGISVLRTHSLGVGILNRLLYRGFLYVFFFLKLKNDDSNIITAYMIVILLIGMTGMFISHRNRKKALIRHSVVERDDGVMRQLQYTFSAVPFCMTFVLCFALVLVEAIF